MPRKKGVDSQVDLRADETSALDKIARLLGILATKDLKQRNDQVATLRAVGFSVAEVASMLRMTEVHVRVAAHHGKKPKKKPKKRA